MGFELLIDLMGVEGLTDESIISSQIKGAIDKGKKLLVKFGFYIPLFSMFLK